MMHSEYGWVCVCVCVCVCVFRCGLMCHGAQALHIRVSCRSPRGWGFERDVQGMHVAQDRRRKLHELRGCNSTSGIRSQYLFACAGERSAARCACGFAVLTARGRGLVCIMCV